MSAPPVPDRAAEDAAAAAVLRHHAELAAGLLRRVEALLRQVEGDYTAEAERIRQDLLTMVWADIFPHALAEEETLYQAAAGCPDGALLVAGMLEEHRSLVTLAGELADSASLVRAAAAARALAALFTLHVTKENELVLPLLVQAPDVSLADLLQQMRERLGEEEPVATEAAGGCGCGGCDCGGSEPSEASAAAPALLSLDARLDVREVPHAQRHALVLSTVEALVPGEAVVLVAPHAPRPVLAQISEAFPGQIRTEWLQSGPVWQIRLERVAVPV